MNMPLFRGRKRETSGVTRRKVNILQKPLAQYPPPVIKTLNYLVTLVSVILCLLMLPTRLPGMEILGMGPNWLLIWVVAWSVKRSAFQGLLAGITLGLLQDAITSSHPSHGVTLGIVGFLTGCFQKQRFIQEDFISIALIVFVMVIVAETIFALQLTVMSNEQFPGVWTYYRQVSLASAVLSSLWAPVLYYPLNLWWLKIKLLEETN